jgi:hypothetical protein
MLRASQAPPQASKPKGRHKKHGRGKHAADAGVPTDQGNHAISVAAAAGSPSQWHQAWDATSGHYYYYNEALQVRAVPLAGQEGEPTFICRSVTNTAAVCAGGALLTFSSSG